jgi:hypothetical protein
MSEFENKRNFDSGDLRYKESDKFKKANSIDVKRSFVAAQRIRKHNVGNKRYLPELTREQFKGRLRLAKKFVSSLSEQELDTHIADEYKKRLKSYNSVDWYVGIVHADEVGVWKGAGGLPVPWTQGSLSETAARVAKDLRPNSRSVLAARAKRAIPRIRQNLDLIENEPYLFPIILPAGTEGRGLRGKSYKGFRLMKGDIDDGCMRAIALVVSGKNSFSAYVGIPRNK